MPNYRLITLDTSAKTIPEDSQRRSARKSFSDVNVTLHSSDRLLALTRLSTVHLYNMHNKTDTRCSDSCYSYRGRLRDGSGGPSSSEVSLSPSFLV